ncbi:MAG: HAMP domain-containing histidine kinase [Bacteroidales bacterium]|jgi:signal transduction histidine kinase|nr:HAMP domain-containing histidine kinase [Bacteroidales bacterium]
MEKFYTKDLDQLIIFRLQEFKNNRLPSFNTEDIEVWNRFNEDILILPFDKKYPVQVVNQKKFFDKAEGHNIDFRIVYDTILIDFNPYMLMSRIPMIEKHDLMRTLSSQYGLLFFVILISLSTVYYYMSKKLWRPFHSTLSKIQNFSLEKDELPKFSNTNTTEFVQLNSILNDHISNNLSIYKKQKEFIENASHELQTPLAVFKSQLDMLLQQPDLSKEQIDIIQSLYSVSSRMTRLNKNLLLLARINNDQYGNMEDIDFVQTLYTQLLYLRERAESNGIKVNVSIEKPLNIHANRILVESLLTNLIVNAIRHNTEDGIINIRVFDCGFEISNTGAAQTLEKDKIFRRFNRTSEEKKGNGLGLSIVHEICKMHGWKTLYDYKDCLHSFVIRFIK